MSGKCLKIAEKLSAYIDGALNDEDRASVSSHIETCFSCSEEFRLISEADARIKRLPPVEPSPFFAARVTAAARALNRHSSSLRRFLRVPVPAMAVMISLITISLFSFGLKVSAMESGPRSGLGSKVLAQLIKPASILNPVALARLCGDCSAYMCQCMHEAGKKSMCPCESCEMDKMQSSAGTGEAGNIEDTEKQHVH
ncbi:MAG: hypothetical protein COX65_00510 [Elusimicrobia bacterium CG_4_10_14_0_2_um_filter_56_8]|nr:MAG: hypothetical protein AUJ51_11345 [Elusimicrobia bacterium CG1_02_56_21]PJA17778.1 MAG: hypothetical protein COX65_00510 [Elusimicrobia bacterium CG_4_10_14_0_2_um_filter_56_8]